ncbi:uncharacterized protein LOC126828338 isoform X2 [Patella vulgata]|nr:uncharacterized protein LOC126828338 isoform X2 [Patella vulgata]XP_050414024.1 uncharacterized protein LOC126828338 isoform X2 [Patella vulgata]XP_050414034.1 uncharacterized protein LOC126828338 isoform X2 [Patella vulgata]
MSLEDESEMIQFVGRRTERESIKTILLSGQHKLIQLHGQTMVGKSRLARQVLLELKHEQEELKVLQVPCSDICSWEHFLQRFVQTCFKDKPQIMEEHFIFKEFKDASYNLVSNLLFTNCEKLNFPCILSGKKFEGFVLKLLNECQNINIMVTSQIRYDFDCCSKDIMVSPLDESDVRLLLQDLLRGFDIQPFIKTVTERCYGLPPYVLDAACCIKANADMAISAKYLDWYLHDERRSKRIHGDNQSGTSVQSLDLIEGLSDYLKKKVIDLSIFRGSFGMDSVTAVLGTDTDNKEPQVKHDLISLKQNSIISTISSNGTLRMCLVPNIESYVRNVLVHRVTYDDVARLKFVTFFGDVLSRANNEMFITSQQTVYGYLRDDWLNLEQVLKEAIHCTDKTFEAFLKVAVGASNLLVKCFPEEALLFYQTMVNVSEIYGSSNNIAVLRAGLGRAITYTKGDDLEKAMALLNDALDVLKDCGASRILIDLKRDMGFNYYKRGYYQEALNCCTNALELANEMELNIGLTNQIIAVRSLIAIQQIFLGNFKKAEELLFETLDLAYKYTPSHLSIAIMINSLGILYERSGNDEYAMKYYRASLIERRKYEDMVPADLVITLNNVGMQYSKRSLHRQGLTYLEEAYSIRQRLGYLDFNTALTLWHMGRVNMLLCDLPRALNLLNEALQIYNKCTKYHSVHIHVRLVLGHCYVLLKNIKDARSCLKEVIEFRDISINQSPKDPHLSLTLGHLVMLVQFDKKLLMEVLKEFDRELDRYLNECSADVREDYQTLSTGCKKSLCDLQKNIAPDFTFLHSVHKVCFVCKDLEAVGYNAELFWKDATSEAKNEASFKEKLISSTVLRNASSSDKDKGQSKSQMNHNDILGRYDSRELGLLEPKTATMCIHRLNSDDHLFEEPKVREIDKHPTLRYETKADPKIQPDLKKFELKLMQYQCDLTKLSTPKPPHELRLVGEQITCGSQPAEKLSGRHDNCALEDLMEENSDNKTKYKFHRNQHNIERWQNEQLKTFKKCDSNIQNNRLDKFGEVKGTENVDNLCEKSLSNQFLITSEHSREQLQPHCVFKSTLGRMEGAVENDDRSGSSIPCCQEENCKCSLSSRLPEDPEKRS